MAYVITSKISPRDRIASHRTTFYSTSSSKFYLYCNLLSHSIIWANKQTTHTHRQREKEKRTPTTATSTEMNENILYENNKAKRRRRVETKDRQRKNSNFIRIKARQQCECLCVLCVQCKFYIPYYQSKTICYNHDCACKQKFCEPSIRQYKS